MMNNNSPLLQEDGPIERSVTLLPPPSSIIRPEASLTILRPAALTRGGGENKSKTTPTTTMMNRRSQSGSINATTTTTTTTSRWEVSSTITEVPWYYALERTCITVDHPTSSTNKGGGGGRRCTSSSSPQGIADRLCNAFRLWNISAIYNNDPTRNNNGGGEASVMMASARLVSSDHVQLNVNLFLDPKKVAGTRRTIVEVQRMSGCCLSFRRYYRAIIEVVHNGGDAEHVVVDDDDTIALAAEAKCSRMGRTPTSFRLPVRKLSLSADDSSISGGGGGEFDDDDDEDGRKNLSTAMEEAHGLLRSDRFCANMLGLEYLSQITTTTAAVQRHSNDNNVDDDDDDDDKLAISVSRAILCGSGDIRDTILSFVVAGEVSGRKNNSDDRSPYDAKYMDILHNLALRVLSNALAVVAREGSLGEVLEEEEEKQRRQQQKERMGSFLNVIIPTLVDEMGQSCPHNACLSARCLRSIVSTSKTGRDLVLTRGGGGGDTTTMDDVIGRAKDVGYRSCVNLERECDRLQSALVVQQ